MANPTPAPCRYDSVPTAWTFRFKRPGGSEIIDVDCLISDPSAWRERPESQDPTWLARPVGQFVLAVRLTG